MDKDEKSELLDTIRALKEELSGDNGDSEEEREMSRIVEKAYKSGRVPIECIEEVPVSNEMVMKTIIFKEV